MLFTISNLGYKRSSWAASCVCKQWFIREKRFSCTRPIKTMTLFHDHHGIILGSVLLGTNFAGKCHEGKLLQFVILSFAVHNIRVHFARDSCSFSI